VEAERRKAEEKEAKRQEELKLSPVEPERTHQAEVDLLSLSPSQFEHLTAELLRRQGFHHVHVVGGPGDYGADITGVDPEGRKVVVQCKRYAPRNKIGSRDVQTFFGMAVAHHEAARAIFVTTSTFTPQRLE
jgi:restriction system protein